ncbi:MAG: hypothetical protein JSU92_04010, partial [Deltaproteobacteria bacterium]
SGRILVACDDSAGSFGTLTNVTITAYGVSDAVGPAAPGMVTVTLQLGEIGVEDIIIVESVTSFTAAVNAYYDSSFGDGLESYEILVAFSPSIVKVGDNVLNNCITDNPASGSSGVFTATEFSAAPTVSLCSNTRGEIQLSGVQSASTTSPVGFFNVANINLVKIGAAGSSMEFTVTLINFCNRSGDCYPGPGPAGYPWATFPTFISNGDMAIVPDPPDLTPPTVDVDPLVCQTTGNVTVSATCTDTGSGVDTCEVSIDSGANWFDSPHVYNGLTTGNYTAIGQATDLAGNPGSDPVGEAFEVDVDIPTVVVDPIPACLTTSNVTVSATCDDVGSGVASCEVTVNGGTWMPSGTVFTLTDGPHTAQARVTDDCGNTGVSSLVPFVVDATPPVVSISSPSSGDCIDSTSVMVDGSVTEAGSGVYELKVEAGIYSATGAVLPITLVIPTDGVYTITLQAEDNCGNIGLVDTVAGVQVDTVTPTGSVSSPVDNGCISASTITVQGSASADVVEITATWGIYSATAASFPVYIDVSGVAEGTTDDLVVDAEDDCGNIGLVDTVTNISIDYTLPTISIVSPTDGSYLKETTIVVSGTADDGTGSISAVLVNGYTANGTDSWSVTLTSDQYGDPVEVGSRDTSGESYEVYVTGGYAYVADRLSGLAIIDVSDPTNPGAPVYRDTLGNSYGVYVTGGYAYVADWGSGLAVIDVRDPTNPGPPIYRDTSGISIEVHVTGGYAYVADNTSGLAVIDVSDPTNPGPPVYRDTSGNSMGVYVTGGYAYVADGGSGLRVMDVSSFNYPVFSAIAVDNCGNVSLQDTVSVTIDPVAPDVSIVSPIYDDCVSSSTVVVTGIVNDPVPSSGIAEVTVNGVSAEVTGGTWVVTLTGQPEGALTLTANAIDALSNSADSNPVIILIDYTLPTVSITSPTSGECINSTSVIVDGDVTEAGSGVYEITVEAGAYSATGTTFPITLVIPADGIYTITTRVEDNCGNIGTDTVANVQVDTVLPVVSIISPTDGECITTSTVVVDASSDGGEAVTCTLDGGSPVV